MEAPNNYDTRLGFKLYRKSDDEWYYWKDEYEDVDPIVAAIKQNIDQGITITLLDLMSPSVGADDPRHTKDNEGLYSFADMQRRRQASWDF